jgi:hypothetical protein
MKSRFQVYVGCVLVLAGIILLAHPDYHRGKKSERIMVGQQQTILQTEEIYSFPRPVSALIVLFGILLAAIGRQRVARDPRFQKPRKK